MGFRKLRRKLERKLPFINPVNVAKDVIATGKRGIEALKDGDIDAARANLRGNFVKQFAPLSSAAQKTWEAERLLASDSEAERQRGLRLKEEAEAKTLKIGIASASFGTSLLAGGATAKTAVTGGIGAARAGEAAEQAELERQRVARDTGFWDSSRPNFELGTTGANPQAESAVQGESPFRRSYFRDTASTVAGAGAVSASSCAASAVDTFTAYTSLAAVVLLISSVIVVRLGAKLLCRHTKI